MTANLTRAPTINDLAEAAARLTGTPQEMADRLRALLDAGPPKPAPRETVEAARERQLATQRQELEVAALRRRLADDFAEARGWRPTTAPLAAKELARRASIGGNWHRPSREWGLFLPHPTFYRDGDRRTAAAVGHPTVDLAESGRSEAEAWAADRELVVSYPNFPSWQYPGRTVLVLFEPAETVEMAREETVDADPVADTVAHGLGSAEPLPIEEIIPPSYPVLVEDHGPLDPEPCADPEPAPMRPVQPIDLGPLVPADLSGQPGPDFDIVAPADLLVDDAYQRGISPKSEALIRRIVRTWSWSKFKPPVVARVDGRLHVIDGQHTAIAAASHGGIQAIPVIVVAVPEMADRARAFVSHATDRLQATPTQIWHAAVMAGDEDALTIARVCRNAGVDLVPFPPSNSEYGPGQTIALHAIRRLIDRRGAMRARQVLEALARADLAPITADHIKVGEALLCDPDYAGEFDAERVTTSMRALRARSYAEARELSIAKHIPAWRALTSVIYRGRTRRSKGVDLSRSEVPEDVEIDPGPALRRSRA